MTAAPDPIAGPRATARSDDHGSEMTRRSRPRVHSQPCHPLLAK